MWLITRASSGIGVPETRVVASSFAKGTIVVFHLISVSIGPHIPSSCVFLMSRQLPEVYTRPQALFFCGTSPFTHILSVCPSVCLEWVKPLRGVQLGATQA